MNNIIKNKEIVLILFLSLILRILGAIYYGEKALVNEWGTLVNNFEKSGTIGIFVIIDQFSAADKYAEIGEKVLPSAFMPPMYFYFIYLIKLFFNNFINFINAIVFFQITLCLINRNVLWNSKLFGKK